MNEHEGLKEQIHGWALTYAERKGYRLNPDKEILDTVTDGLAKMKRSTARGTARVGL